MGRFKQQSITELLKRTHKLTRPKMTPILEGKNHMQGPLDTTDNGLDSGAMQVCGICRNHMDASIAQDCSACKRFYHTFCLEPPDPAAKGSTKMCCYYCKYQGSSVGLESPTSHRDPLMKLSDQEIGIWRSSANTQDCGEPGTSYNVSAKSPTVRKKDSVSNEHSLLKVLPVGITSAAHEPTKARAARKLSTRQKKTPHISGHENSSSQILSSDSGTSSNVTESSGIGSLSIPTAPPSMVGSTEIACIGHTADLGANDSNFLTVQNDSEKKDEQVLLVIQNDEQLVEECIVPPRKDMGNTLEECRENDSFISEADIPASDKDNVNKEPEEAVKQLVRACPLSQDHIHNISLKDGLMPEESEKGLLENVKGFHSVDSVDSKDESHSQHVHVDNGSPKSQTSQGSTIRPHETVTELHYVNLPNSIKQVQSSSGSENSDLRVASTNKILSETQYSVQEQQVIPPNELSKENKDTFKLQDAIVMSTHLDPMEVPRQNDNTSKIQVKLTSNTKGDLVSLVQAEKLSSAHSDLSDLPKQDADTSKVQERDSSTNGELTLSPRQAGDTKLFCASVEGGDSADGKCKSVDTLKERSSSVQKEVGELQIEDANKDVQMEEQPDFTIQSLMEVDGPVGVETDVVVDVDSSDAKAASEDVVQVCDICGDVGIEDMLSICSDCNGAEHVYCYESLMAQVPEGQWQCDACKSKQKGSNASHTSADVGRTVTGKSSVSHITKKQCGNGSSRSRLLALLEKRKMPLDKRRPFKGPLSSQFPAKRSVVAGESTMGPSPKRQAMESSSMSSMPSSKSFLSRESSFKSPETGKVKFVSPAALIGTSCEGKGLSPAVGKLPNLAGSSTFTHLNSSANQAAHFSKGCFPNPGNLVNKASTSSQLTNPSMTTPSSSYVSRTPCTSKSSEVLPSFLLPSKSAPSKLQPISKTVKDFPDSFSQGFTKEGIQGSKGVLTARMSTKTSSFKLPKGVVTSESRLKNEVNSDLGKLQSSKVSCSEAVMVKATNNKQDDRSISGKKESACKAAYKAEAKTEPQSHAEICRGISSIDQLGKQELAEGCKALERLSAHSNMPTATCSNETKISSGHISLRKDPQPISAGQDVQIALQHLSSESMVRQESRMPDQHLSMKSLNNTRESTMQSTTLKAEETGSVQQAVYDDHMPQEKHLLEKSPALDFVSCLTLKSRECSSMGSSMYASVPGIHGHHACKDFIDSAKDSGCHVSRTGLSLEGIDMPKSDTSFLDNAVQPLQKTGETYPVTKPLMQMTPQTKLMSVERMVPAQDTGDEVQLQMQEQPRGSIVTSSKLLSVGLDPLLKKDTLDFKEQGADNSIHSSATVNKSAVGSSKVKIIDLNVDHNINSECTAVDTSAYVPDTAVLTPFTAPILPVPSKIKSTARFSDSLGLLSNTTAKVISTITSQTQESGKVYPEAQIVWQGIFDVTSTAGTQVNFYGLQAHPSNCALPKVREVARQLQPSLPLKELPRGSEHNSWPLHFQKVAPNSDNIALYFFASDKESYVQYYKPLVDRLIKFDLTLKGFIEDVELLIFPSSLLPLGSQCWNNFMFLWAVFRARKHPVKQHVVHNQTNGTKEVGRETNLKIAVQSGVPPFSWGNMEDRQVEGSGSKNSDVLQVPVKKTENPPSEIKGVNCERPIMEADPQVVTCQQKEPCRMEVQQPLLEPFSPEEKNTRAKSPSPSNVIVVQGQAADLTPIRFEGIPVAGSDVSLKTLSGLNFDKIDADSKFLASSAVDTNSLNLKGDHGEHVADVKLGGSTAVDTSSVPSNGEHGGTERLKHVGSLMVTSSPPKCPGPTERQDDLWISHRLNSEKGGRDRSHDKFDKPELQRLSKERDRDKPRDREKHKERDKDRSRRFSDYEWERERDKCRDRDRDKDRDRYRDRCKDRERDRERWRERDERERYYRDREWDRDKVGERNKGRERRDRESERERASAREWINRYRYRDVDGNYLRSGRHRYRHPRSHTPSRSPPGSRGRSPLRARGDRYHHRYYRSSCRSRSYSPSSDSDHCLVYTRPDTASRDLSKDSSAHKAKVSAVIAAKEESIVKNYSGKDYGMGDQGNISQRGSNSSSVCREHSIDVGRKFPIADLNLSPYEMEDFEEEVEGEVIMPAEVIEPSTTKNVDYVICNQREIFHHNGRANKETGECSISAGKVVSYQSTEHLTHVSERTDSLSQSLVNDTSGPSLFPVGTSAEGSSSCLQFLPHDLYVEPSTTDLKLALGTKEQEFSETQVELPFYMQLLEPSQGNSRLGSQQPSLDVPMLSGQGELTLSLGIAENPKRALNTNLSLFR